MVRARALELFNDGWEKRLRYPGEIFETTQERLEYWCSASLVCLAGDERPNLDGMTKAQLMEYAKEHDMELDDKARKADIIAAIKEAMGWT